jgi:hypothetical protein
VPASKIHGARFTEIEQAAHEGLVDAARIALPDARARAPKDSGKLRRSGRVVQDDDGAIVRFTAPHAWLQHENLDYEHPDGGEPKFLENAALEVDLGQIVANAVREATSG